MILNLLMKRHPYTRSIRVKCWHLNREIKQRGEMLEIE